MTNAEFQEHLDDIYASYPFICKPVRKTVNILFYVLQRDVSVTDYNINLVTENGKILCVPSVKESFVPVKTLAMHVKEVVCEEEDYGFDGLCLTVYVEE